jgi:hypothetical protein
MRGPWRKTFQSDTHRPCSFSDPAAGKSSQLQGVGLRLGFAGGEALNQVAVIRNVGDSNTTITGRVTYTDQGGTTNTIPIADLTLYASETVIVDLGRRLQEHGHYHPDAIGSLELEYSTVRGSVIASTLSVSGSGNQVFRVPMWDIYGLRSSTGGYPWSIDGDSSTFVYIKNSSDHQQHYFMNVHFDCGDYQIGRKTIDAGQTVTFDLRKLRDEQLPDIHGQKIPLTVQSGQVHWTKSGTEDGVLIGRSEQVNAVLGISSNYACANCCDDSARNGRISPNTATQSVGQTYTFVAMDDLQDCYGYSFPQEIYDATWSSSNDSVASVSVGTATAQSPGTATITASFYDDRHVVVLCGGGGGFGGPPPFGSDCCESQTVHFTPTATLNVVCAVPTNFHQTTVSDAGNGTMHVEYAWSSSTGNLSDLGQCSVDEYVDYNSSDLPFASPPFPGGINPPNPTILPSPPVVGSTGTMQDNHQTPGSFVKPYSEKSITARQRYRYTCPCANNGQPVILYGPLSIVRSVTFQNNRWQFIISKDGNIVIIDPLP